MGLLLCHLLLGVFVALRLGLRRREALLFVAYLAISVAWFLAFGQYGVRALWPLAPWERAANYLLVGLGLLFWDFARAFLQKPRLPIAGWISAGIVLLILALLDSGLIPVPPLALGPITLDEWTRPFLAGAAAALAYGAIAIVTTLVEYVRRPSPLHRNRIAYWLLGTVALVGGIVTALTASQALVEVVGGGVHMVGAALLTYTLLQYDLPDIATGIRRALSYVLTVSIPALITVGLSMGVVYLLDQSSLLQVQFSEGVLIGLVVAGAAVVLFHRPLSGMTRRTVDRLLFGRGREVQEVVREYSQAVTQVLSLEPLVETAMRIIDDALGIQRGTLLVVEETREAGWWLRVIEGRNVPADLPCLVLVAGTPLAEWLVEQGAPLHQYTLDVDRRFDVLDQADREAWRRLDMEVFFPIKRSGALIGLLAVGVRRSGRPYTARDLALLATLADQTAVALENASLFFRVQRRAEQLALLNEIGRTITASLDLEAAIGLIAGRIADAFEDCVGFVFLLDEARRNLVLQSAFGAGVPDLRNGDTDASIFRVQLGRGLVGRVAEEGTSALVLDLPGDVRYVPEIEGVLAPGAESALCVPLLATRDRAIGVILVAAQSRASLGAAELDLLDSIAAFASIAIQNARQVAAREEQLRRQVEALRIEIDEMKRKRRVDEITDTDYFRGLQEQARELRRRVSEEQE